jgi:hypothetical protein
MLSHYSQTSVCSAAIDVIDRQVASDLHDIAAAVSGCCKGPGSSI